MLWCDYNEFYVMNRIKCIVSYDGSKFHGFQVQNQFRTVQGEIQKAIKNTGRFYCYSCKWSNRR